MSGSGAFAHIPSSEDDSRTLLNQPVAVIVGVVATLIGLWLTSVGFDKLKDTVGHLIWLIIAVYVVALAVQFWVAQSYKNGMTKKEIVFALLWPIDVVRSIRRGLRAAMSQVPGTNYQSDDEGKKVIDEQTSFIIGLAVSAVAAILLVVGIFQALAVIWSAFWLLVICWIIGAIVQFWVAQSWRDGLTVKELTMAAIWPLGMGAVIRAGVKKFQQPNAG